MMTMFCCDTCGGARAVVGVEQEVEVEVLKRVNGE